MSTIAVRPQTRWLLPARPPADVVAALEADLHLPEALCRLLASSLCVPVSVLGSAL